MASGLLKVNTNIEDIEPLDIAWGPINQTLIVGGELRVRDDHPSFQAFYFIFE